METTPFEPMRRDALPLCERLLATSPRCDNGPLQHATTFRTLPQCLANPSRAEPSRAEPGRAGPGRAGPGRAGPSRASAGPVPGFRTVRRPNRELPGHRCARRERASLRPSPTAPRPISSCAGGCQRRPTSAVPAQMWQGWATSRRRCGRALMSWVMIPIIGPPNELR